MSKIVKLRKSVGKPTNPLSTPRSQAAARTRRLNAIKKRSLPKPLVLTPAAQTEFAHLVEHGYMVIPNVLDEEECRQGISDMWLWLESLGRGIQRADPTTYTGSQVWPENTHGIMQYPSMSHSTAAWRVRMNPKVIDTYVRLLGATTREELLVSFDRANIQRPSSRAVHEKPWIHLDQGTTLRGFQCVQGYVTLEDADIDDGTLTVLPGSHLHHDEFFHRFPERTKSKENWVKFTDDEMKWWCEEKGLAPLRVAAPAGSLVLWDSRTAHSGSWPLPDRAHPDRWRRVVYVCYGLRSRLNGNKELLEEKQQAFLQSRSTSHWPDVVRAIFPNKPGRWAQGQVAPAETVDCIATLEQLQQLSPLGPVLAGF